LFAQKLKKIKEEQNMETRILANKAINPIGLGCMGMSEFYGETDEKQSMDVLHKALSLGINHFDTADAYGYGHNEKLLGAFIDTLGSTREKISLATKCGIVRDNNISSRNIDNSPEYIQKACQGSLSRLNSYIDLYYLHRIQDNGQYIDESMSAMADLLKEGKIRAVGLSEASPEIILKADQSLKKYTQGQHGLSAVQTEYSIVTPVVEQNGVLETVASIGAKLVAYSPIGRGMLSGTLQTVDSLASDDFRRGLPRFSEDNLKENNRLVEAIISLANENSITPSQLSLAWLLARSEHVITIPGTKRERYLIENAAAADIQLSQSDMQVIDDVIADNPIQGLRYAEPAMLAYGLTE
jgi:aryl-alcohol dehydrogenase-like predicted oxidoreductase